LTALTDPKESLDRLHARLGLKRLHRGWAKAEVFLGLAAAGSGLLFGVRGVTTNPVAWEGVAAGLALFVLGGYLALAGHRSHLYQSNNELTAYLAEEVRQQQAKEPPR
jgi:hypothetical protein